MTQPTDNISLGRMAMLMKKFITENWRTLALRTGLMYGLIALGSLIVVWISHKEYTADSFDYDHDFGCTIMAIMFIFALNIFGCISASLTFSDMDSKEKRLGALTLPAHTGEKFIIRWTIYIAVFILMFLAACFLGECLRVSALSVLAEDYSRVHFMDYRHLLASSDGHLLIGTRLLCFTFLLLQSIFCLGSIVWDKGTFIKTFISLGVIAVVYAFIAYLTITGIQAENNIRPAYSGSTIISVFICIEAVFTIICYVLAYRRFTESEIINRW